MDISINDDKKQQKDDQKQDKVTVHQGGHVEGAPTSVESSGQSVENYVESSESEPQISDEEAQVGVEKVHSEPKLHPDAKKAGVSHSIPKGPNFKIDPVDINTGEEEIKKGDVVDANIWRTLLKVIDEKRNIFLGLIKK